MKVPLDLPLDDEISAHRSQGVTEFLHLALMEWERIARKVWSLQSLSTSCGLLRLPPFGAKGALLQSIFWSKHWLLPVAYCPFNHGKWHTALYSVYSVYCEWNSRSASLQNLGQMSLLLVTLWSCLKLANKLVHPNLHHMKKTWKTRNQSSLAQIREACPKKFPNSWRAQFVLKKRQRFRF